ncbi:endo-1,4-beta-xylanase [uncultured Bacteroides sp.]|uniref:endo-1,4-beta-xylanase n=1 Tax=uncultured Bacteroides sp. TaxID=162156 RepID=UPI002AAC48FE|nr:endo-1,4-beta-xylanase [uncultured Bacteroides sp.]
MKQYINKLLITALGSAIIAGCADTGINDFSVEKPSSIATMEYLNDYAPLKSYIDRTIHPNFKLGTGISESDFNQGGLVYRLASANFDEITPGNAMKYSSCVAKDGSMSFSEVTKFIEMAKSASLSVYGHTLAWHSQQQNEYLNSLIADKVIAVDPSNVEHALHIKTPEAKANIWDWQIYNMLPEALTVGQEYTISIRAKATAETDIAFWPNNADGSKVQYLSNFSVKKDWGVSSFKFTASIPIQKLVFSFGKFIGDLYINDVTLTATGSNTNLIANSSFENADLSKWSKPSWHSYTYAIEALPSNNTIPLTPKEKADTLTWAMDRWVKGMMEACGGYVKSWDVVNEAISGGGDDGEGFYVLQSASNGDPLKNFYWQDYFGSEEYVRKVVGMARKYYAQFKGNPSDLKLFINDYNLESDWDDNKKLKSLIHWIQRWEKDGVTKINGIGSQMHVSYFANAAKQKSKEEHIVKMFELLAASGKLVKISELDLGYIDEGDKTIKTVDITQEQHKAMAEFYKFIVKKYFEIIPVAQQYGITTWSITDSPDSDSSFWRAGEPIGLWDLNYNRKHTYAGYADGLAGK